MRDREVTIKARERLKARLANHGSQLTRDEVINERSEREYKANARRRWRDACRYARKKGNPLPEIEDFVGLTDENQIQRRIRLLREGKL